MPINRKKVGERVRQLRLQAGLTQRQLAEKIRASAAMINRLEKGINFNERSARDVADALTVNYEALVSEAWDGAAPNKKSYSTQQENARIVPLKSKTRRIPVVSWARAGEAKDYSDLATFIDESIETDCKDPNAFALIVEGDSMEPALRAGDRVVVVPNSEPRNGDIVVARTRDTHEVYLKLFHRVGHKGEKIRLTSYNQVYPPLEFDSTAFRFIYPIHSMLRMYRHG